MTALAVDAPSSTKQAGGRVDAAMPSTSQAQKSFEIEVLTLWRKQGRFVPLPMTIALLVIAFMALPRAPTLLVVGWSAFVLLHGATRMFMQDRIGADAAAGVARVKSAAVLNAVTGLLQGSTVLFFPYLPDVGRAAATMIVGTMVAGSIATTAGYRPLHFAVIFPSLWLVALGWAITPPSAEAPSWIAPTLAALVIAYSLVVAKQGTEAGKMFRDAIEARQREAQSNLALTAALAQAETANRAKARFLGSASHDLRQPLHTVSLFGAALQERRDLTKEAHETVLLLNAATNALSSQLGSLLDISNLDAGVVEVRRGQLPLKTWFEVLRQQYEPLAAAKGLRLQIDCNQEVCVVTDSLLFERLLRNLIDNAVKYTQVGFVRVAVAAHGDSHWRISVTDSGCGIPLHEQQRVFEEFYQLGNPERDRTRGFGLGLAIVQRLCDLLGHPLELRSEPGMGSEFSLVVPRTVAAEHRIPAEQPHADLAGSTVLIIDDEAGVRKAMAALLKQLGCRTLLAASTMEALQLCASTPPDVVLADFRLRDGDDGLDAIRKLRRLYPGLPALLISGDTAPERLREAHQSGVSLLHKPVPTELLRGSLATALHKQTAT